MSKEKTKGFYVLGVGESAPVYIELLEALDLTILGLYHYRRGRTGERVHGYPVVGSNDELFDSRNLSDYSFALSMGDNDIRMNLGEKIRSLGGKVPTLIDPAAVVSRGAVLEEGVVVKTQSMINPNVAVGRDTSVSFNAVISHGAQVGPACFIGPTSVVGANTTLGERVFVGASAVVGTTKGITIGGGAVIGAGAVVTKNVPAGVTVVGNPARPLRS